MQHSINIADKASYPNLKVGAVLVSADNMLICSAYSGESDHDSCLSVLLDKVKQLKIIQGQSLYLTINTLSKKGTFSLTNLLKEINIRYIYIGLPDPSLTSYLPNDPFFIFDFIYRYPLPLQIEILKENQYYYEKSSQSIKNSAFYSQNRISKLVLKKLDDAGYSISIDELNLNKSRDQLADFISKKYKIHNDDAKHLVDNVISESFNDKYADYNYSFDSRSLKPSWKDEIFSIYRHLSDKDIANNYILNVGVGGGQEAITLFSNCSHITFVDIAKDGLNQVKKRLPSSRISIASADNLFQIASNSYDLYISLRTYNSSFFDIDKAVKEAARVLKSNSIIIISVANGFLHSKECRIIPGLIIPGTEFIDIYRSLDTVKQVRAALLKANFNQITIIPTSTEIYLSAVSS